MMTRVCASSEPRLVEQQNLGTGRQRPYDADALLHAAGQPVWILVLELQQAGEAEERARRGLPAVLALALHLESELDVAAHRLPGKQRVLLEHHAAIGARPVDRLAVDRDRSAGGLEKSGDSVEQGRLAAARWPDDRHELAGRDMQRHVFDRLDLAVQRVVGQLEVPDLHMSLWRD
jgi:hypothetical protein